MQGGEPEENEMLRREVLELRARVAELQRAAARHEDTSGISLAEREELLREAERIIQLGTWTWDIQSGRVSWSDGMFRLLGFEPSDCQPSVEGFLERVHPEDRARVEETTSAGLRDGVFPLFDCRIVRLDGSERLTTIYGSCLFDARGEPRRMVGALLDRTEYLRKEGDLRWTLGLLEEAQRFAQLGSWRFDPQTEEVEWSNEFRRIAGLGPQVKPDVREFLARVVPEDQAHFVERYQKALLTPAGGEVDGRLRLPSGDVRHIRLNGAFLPGKDGRQELRGTLLDITDQVRMREDLAQSQKMEAIGRLAAGIAHDFNNLLTIVTGNLELLVGRVGHAPELDDSLRAVESASNLTRRLLAFGRRAQLSLTSVAPNDLVQSTMSLLHRLVKDHVKLEVSLAENLPHVRVDALEIERALVNLVVNARDVMPAGGVVKITTRESTSEARKWVELSVSDNGPGIRETDLPHLFEPFYTTRHNSGGTGLGLATVLGTAEQHGGTVRVTTLLGGGSEFIIVLPAVARERTTSVAPPARSVSPRATESLTVLVVDDEPMVAEATRRMLTARGHQVYVATGPEEAESVWAKLGPSVDLVLCDIVMPGLRGPELVAQLTAQGGRPLRVLFMSGYNEESSLAQQGRPVLAKPFSLAALEDAISSVMAETQSHGPAHS